MLIQLLPGIIGEEEKWTERYLMVSVWGQNQLNTLHLSPLCCHLIVYCHVVNWHTHTQNLHLI